jgi:hypothetical protein
MPGNNDPIYSRIGDTTTNGTTGMPQPITAAANDYTGVSASNAVAFTADATNGGFIQRLRFKANGTNVATVARIYVNNGSTNTTAANNSLIGEQSLPATTSIATASLPDIDYQLNFALPPGFRILVGLGTAVAAGWTPTPIAGKY